MNTASAPKPETTPSHMRDYVAGLVVFLVALPLCLGIALASNAPLVSGLISGIIGGIVVGFLSGSHTSISGPAAGLAAVVTAQLVTLGSFENFLVAVMIAGLIQIVLGSIRAGLIALVFPSSVIRGLLAAIGVLLIIKQIPHVIGAAPKNIGGYYLGATAIGAFSVVLLLIWDRIGLLKRLPIPSALVVVATGVVINVAFAATGSAWVIPGTHLVQIPTANSLHELSSFIPSPAFSALSNPKVYVSGVTIAVIASLETLLNLNAVDKIDTLRRVSPPNRELVAQGIGNFLSGLLGGLPITSVIVRGSVNVSAGAKTRRSAVTHGFLLLAAVALFPSVLNRIPLASLAAILLLTGFKLASPKVVKSIAKEGRRPLVAFAVTVVGIVATDLLMGILIGLVVSVFYVLHNTFRAPLRLFREKHVAQDVLRIELSSQVGFFSRARLEYELNGVPSGGHVLIDARRCDYVDPDVLETLKEFRLTAAPARGVTASFLGFKSNYPDLGDQIEFVDFTTRDRRTKLSTVDVVDLLADGNRRFRSGHRLTRDIVRQSRPADAERVPFATVLSYFDIQLPVENLFDLGTGDVLSIRVAANAATGDIQGSVEYGCKEVGTGLFLVLGHTHSETLESANEAKERVLRTLSELSERSSTIATLVANGNLGLAGGIFHSQSGLVEFFDTTGRALGSEAHPVLQS